jgi:hypothetical protein
MRCSRFSRCRHSSAVSVMPEMSPPAQKLPPAPVVITTRTAASPSASARRSWNTSRMARSMTLRRAGLSMVMSAMPSVTP